MSITLSHMQKHGQTDRHTRFARDYGGKRTRSTGKVPPQGLVKDNCKQERGSNLDLQKTLCTSAGISVAAQIGCTSVT
jgi:hypothetical protein